MNKPEKILKTEMHGTILKRVIEQYRDYYDAAETDEEREMITKKKAVVIRLLRDMRG